MNQISLKTELYHELKLTPQLLQSMQLLQMNSQELLKYLGEMVEENPLLEHDEISERDKAKEFDLLQQKLSWLDCGHTYAGRPHRDDTMVPTGSVGPETESLSSFLKDQLTRLRLPQALHALCLYMIELLDEDGYWEDEDFQSLAALKIPSDLINQATKTIQSLDPAGVGARNLSECLLLQIERNHDAPSYIQEMITHHLEELGRHQYSQIARALNLSVSDIKDAEKIITSLQPRPGQAFAAEETPVYIRPDVFVVELDGDLQIILNEYYLPRLSISNYYVNLLQEDTETETQEYLRQKLTQAKWIISSLERRNSTLLRCAEEILSVQHSFFGNNTPFLNPMTLSSLAQTLGLHVSTVSRAIRGKYIQCRQGTFPVKYFFTRSMGTADLSSHDARQQIVSLIAQEDHNNPYSDQKLAELLREKGYRIARRTVAKYREAAGIPSSGLRKQ